MQYKSKVTTIVTLYNGSGLVCLTEGCKIPSQIDLSKCSQKTIEDFFEEIELEVEPQIVEPQIVEPQKKIKN